MNEELSEQVLGLVQLGLAHVLNLFGDVFEVKLVRQVSACLGQAAQGFSLLLRPGVDVLVIQAAPIHELNLAHP
jgi:hypothetical protein